MRRATLIREIASDEGTLGELDLSGHAPLHVMEPPWRDNRRNRSCIPEGAYQVVPHVSPRFGRCLLVTDVPDRSHILFHAGNVGGDVDKGYHTHTLGCLLPGLMRGAITVKGIRQMAVMSSRTAFRHLMTWADAQPFDLEVVHV